MGKEGAEGRVELRSEGFWFEEVRDGILTTMGCGLDDCSVIMALLIRGTELSSGGLTVVLFGF